MSSKIVSSYSSVALIALFGGGLTSRSIESGSHGKSDSGASGGGGMNEKALQRTANKCFWAVGHTRVEGWCPIAGLREVE